MSAADGGGQVRLLLWDAPDMELRLHDVLGRRPTASQRPDLRTIATWLEDRCRPGERVEAVVFTSMNPGHEKAVVRWVVGLRNSGLRVFVKPRTGANDDIDGEIGEYLSAHLNQGELIEVFLASHERKAFMPALERSYRSGIETSILGFWELEEISPQTGMRVMDIRDVPGAFDEPIPRTDLRNLPTTGRWFEPLRALRSEAAEAWATQDEKFAEFDSPPEFSLELRSIADTAPPSSAQAETPALEPAPSVPELQEQHRSQRPAPPLSPPPDTNTAGSERTGPSREQVLRYVSGRVDAAIEDGDDGLTDAVINRKLKMRFRGLDLETLGFGSVSGVMLAVAATGPFSLIEVDDGRHMLVAGPTHIASADADAIDIRDDHTLPPASLARTTMTPESSTGFETPRPAPTPDAADAWFSAPGLVPDAVDDDEDAAAAPAPSVPDSDGKPVDNLAASTAEDQTRAAPPWPELPGQG